MAGGWAGQSLQQSNVAEAFRNKLCGSSEIGGLKDAGFCLMLKLRSKRVRRRQPRLFQGRWISRELHPLLPVVRRLTPSAAPSKSA